MRTGSDYIASLRADGRSIVCDGEIVKDVTSHPAFRGAVRSIANLYDMAFDPANRDLMTFISPMTRQPVLRCFQVPETIADLGVRRKMITKWAEATYGLMGRTPDHVASFFAGFVAKPDVFAAGGNGFAENLMRFFEFARDHHLYLSYAIVQLQIDRTQAAHKQPDPTLLAGVVRETDAGIVLKGGQQLATGAALSDWLFLSNIRPLQAGDENYAISAVIPMTAAGLRIYARRSYARNVESTFDYPLSSRFDETDSLVVFDDVLVPWENVFVYRNVQICRDQWHKTPAYALGNHQAQVRYATKLKFLAGLAKRMIELTGVDTLPPVQVQMGELVALATIVESMAHAQEAMGTIDSEGAVWPSRTALNAIMSLQSELNPRVIEIVRELSGSATIMPPSSHRDYENPIFAADLERYVASSGMGVSSRERIALMRMVWDMVGTEFAGRHHQYEKFYGGLPVAVKQNMYRNYDFEHAKRLVTAALALPSEEFDNA